ncbi:prepilin-type N-terminal cleavage/methylation domain-containing protein [Idiomarina sp. ST20R2A10]|uniref:prepilin-type N-terminal cleavage/methylation domain-containing protein n=1 Tax=Idiomarina sp. ST20R2A10 TaxID=3418369 RepID=UPI003EC8D46A
MKSRGFTLIELIIILVIIGILAVSAAPVFFDSSGTQSQVLRQQAMSILRSIQQQAMQNTDKPIELQVTQTTLGMPPYNNENNLQISNSGIEFSPADFTIGFDGLGRPTQDCEGGCVITLKESSGVDRVISINKEGFINAQ